MSSGKVLVYGTDELERLLVLPEPSATQMRQTMETLREAENWGDVRRGLPEEMLAGLYHWLGIDPEDPPADDESYDDRRDRRPSDDAWPPDPADQMLRWLPSDIKQRFFIESDSMAGGSIGFDRDQLFEVLEAFDQAGYSCKEDDRLIWELVDWILSG